MRRDGESALDELTEAVLAAVDDPTAVPAMYQCAHSSLLSMSHCHLSSLHMLSTPERAATVSLFPHAHLNELMSSMSTQHPLEHPLLRHHILTGDVEIHTPDDVARDWRSSWVFEYLRLTTGVVEHIAVPVDFTGGLRVSFALGRDSRPFDDAERDALTEAQRVLRIGWRAVRVGAAARARVNAIASSRTAGLTSREREVLEALASGRARRVVARELGVSVRTLDKHVEHVNTKLGTASLLQSLDASSRTEVASRV